MVCGNPRCRRKRSITAERPAPKKVAELLLDEARYALTVTQLGRLGTKRLEVVAHHLIQDTRRGLPGLIGCRWGGHARRSAGPMPRRATPETGGYSDGEPAGGAVSAYATGAAHGSCHTTRRGDPSRGPRRGPGRVKRLPSNDESQSEPVRNVSLAPGREFDTCPGRGANLFKYLQAVDRSPVRECPPFLSPYASAVLGAS